MDSRSNLKKRPSVQDEQRLREESKNWNAQEWESYLESLEGGRAESLSTIKEVEQKGLSLNIFDWADKRCPPEIRRMVAFLISNLSEQQEAVLIKIFFEGRSERETARLLGLSHRTVYRYKRRAIKNLRKCFQKVTGASRIGEAQVVEIQIKPGADDENPAA